jgi:hypothetical protein
MKEARYREIFELRSQILKKPRNPCFGELTARDDADFLIPMEQTLKTLAETEAFQAYKHSKALEVINANKTVENYHLRAINPADMARLQTLRNRRNLIDVELKQLELVKGVQNINLFNRLY